MNTLTTDLLPARTATVAAGVGFIGIAAFQAALALGAPLGRAVWGGTHSHLPMGLRVASAIAAGVWVLASLIVLGRAGSQISPLPSGFVRWGTRILVVVSVLGAHELRVAERLGALPLGAGRVDSGGAVPGGRAQRSHKLWGLMPRGPETSAESSSRVPGAPRSWSWLSGRRSPPPPPSDGGGGCSRP